MNRLLKAALAAATLLTGVSFLPGCNGANDNALNLLDKGGTKGFMIKTLARGDRQRKYGLFVPAAYNPANRYPVIVFLHGIGEGGDDAHANLRVGLAPFVALRSADFPFIVIFPQSPDGSWHENSQAAEDVIAELDEVSKQYSVDQDRVSLTGLSTGGYGTYAIGAKYRNRFAALVPMGSNESGEKWADQLVDMPIHAFCNGGDMFGAFTANDNGTIQKIKTLGGRKQEFTATNGPGHDCWEGVYSDGEVFAWLLQQRRTHASTSIVLPRPTLSMVQPAVAPVGARSNAAAAVNTPY